MDASDPVFLRRCRIISRLAGWPLAAVCGGVALWRALSPDPYTWLPSGHETALIALMGIIQGIALKKDRAERPFIRSVLTGFPLVLALCTLLILLFLPSTSSTLPAPFGLFVIAWNAGALLLDRGERLVYAGQLFLMIAACMGLFAIIGFVYFLYDTPAYSGLSLLSGLTGFALGIGMLCSRPDRGVMRVMSSPGPGGTMMRRLFVSVATLPSVLGVVRLEAMRIGWIDDPTSASLLILVITLAFVFLIGRYARRLEAAEQARIDAEAEKERAELLVAVQRMQAIRADRLRALGEMATAVAHELNQPLFGVRGAAEHLLLGLDRGWDATDEKIRNRLKQILDQSDRMTHIIQHIRRFGRRDDSETPETVRISDVLVSTVDLLETQLRLHGINLNVESDNRAPPVRINRYALEEVMINLVINARDAVEERRERERNFTGRITLRVYASERGVVLEIRDNGPGIAEEHMNRIFEPFFTTKAPDTGTGLGLPICRMLIEEAGGTIEVLSTPGDGVVVRVTLSSAEVI